MRPFALPILLMLCLLGTGCSREPAIERLLERVDALQQAVEDKKNDAAMAMLSTEFATGKGQSRQDAQRMLLFYSLRHNNITIIRTQTDASLDSAHADQARVRFNAIVTGGQGLLPEQGRSYAVDSRWVFTDNDWYLDALHWESLL